MMCHYYFHSNYRSLFLFWKHLYSVICCKNESYGLIKAKQLNQKCITMLTNKILHFDVLNAAIMSKKQVLKNSDKGQIVMAKSTECRVHLFNYNEHL